MARATSHGAAAAANSSNYRRRHGASLSPSGQNSSGRRQNNNEEATGLLSASPDDDDDTDGSGIIVHPGSDSNSDSHHSEHHHHNPRGPRTPNRVRFDLRPTFVDSAPSSRRESSDSTEHHDNPYARSHPPPRESFDLDDADPLTHQAPHQTHQRIPLLTGIEAPSVTVATNSPFVSEHGEYHDAESWAAAERARPKSSLPAAFMNMANSIIGAGIIGQPYAFRQAGLLAGTVLLVVLTFVVDWTIRLIVVNSKLSGASSFQGTVEKCFGRTGLVAISVAQWVFAFGGMVAFGVVVGDSIPSVLRAIWPGLADVPVLGLLADRRAVIVLFTTGISYPLTLYRDIAKVRFALLSLFSLSPSPLSLSSYSPPLFTYTQFCGP